MNRNRKTHWMAAAAVAVAMVAGSSVVASAGEIGTRLPGDSRLGDRSVTLGHNLQSTIELGDLVLWMPLPLSSGLPLIGRLPTLGFADWGMPVVQHVLRD